MTKSEAKEILEAYMECYRRKTEVAYDYQCDKDCEACGLNYEQGTVGEHNEAVTMAINALEKQIPKKPIFTEDKQFALCPCCDMKGLIDKQKYCDYCGQKLDWSDEE